MWNPPKQEDLLHLPELYETEKVPLKEKIIYLHFFIGGFDWYITEYDGDELMFGFVILNNDFEMAEWGYISFQELLNININGFEIDRDLFWKQRPANHVDKICKAQGWEVMP